MTEKEFADVVKKGIEQAAKEQEEKYEREKHYEMKERNNALLLVLPFFLSVLCIMFFVNGIKFFSEANEQNLKKNQNDNVMAVIENPGNVWENFKTTWENSSEWNDLKEVGEYVAADWTNRGVAIDWDYMTKVFKSISRDVTFSRYEDAMFYYLKKDFYSYYGADPSTNYTTAIVCIIIGILIAALLVFRIKKNKSFLFMFFKKPS